MRVSTSLLIVIAAAFGCYRDAAAPSSVASATILLGASALAGSEVERVEVYVTEIAASTEPDSIAGTDEWSVVVRPGKPVALDASQDGAGELLGDGLLRIGTYRTMRVAIDGEVSRVWFRDGRQAKVRWPNDGVFAFGAPADVPITVYRDGIEILIELDIAQSFTTLLADPLHDVLFAPVATARGALTAFVPLTLNVALLEVP